MNRTPLALPPVPFDQHDRAILDFVQTIKATETPKRSPMVRADYEDRAAQFAASTGRAPKTLDDVDSLMRDSVTWQYDRALWRFTQEMMYGRIRDALLPSEADLRAWLNTPVQNPIGTEKLNPNLPMPAYYAADYHLQPGGMHKEELVPFVTRVSNDVFGGGRSNNFEFQAQAAQAIPDGNWHRILDQACGFKSAIPIKQRFPNAVVYGIDLSAPLIQYAHRLAESMGLAIHYEQQDAQRTTYPDNFFDVVFNTILFHEVPDEVAANIFEDSYRILRPGGWLVIDDTPTYDRIDPMSAYESDWNTTNNVEPYWRDAANRDLPAWLAAVGFRDIEAGPKAGPPRVSARVTRARK